MKLNKVTIMESTLGAPDPMKVAYVKQCDVLQDRINALEKVLSCALNDNYWHELGCDSDPCTCWVAEARALLNK